MNEKKTHCRYNNNTIWKVANSYSLFRLFRKTAETYKNKRQTFFEEVEKYSNTQITIIRLCDAYEI